MFRKYKGSLAFEPISLKSLGLIDLKECRGVSLGKCITNDDHQRLVLNDTFKVEAHTHVCESHASYRIICFPRVNLLWDRKGEISDLMVHEFGHVLVDYKSKCENLHAPRFLGHGKEWQKAIEKFNRPHLFDGSVALSLEEWVD